MERFGRWYQQKEVGMVSCHMVEGKLALRAVAQGNLALCTVAQGRLAGKEVLCCIKWVHILRRRE
jgi:hypothetical protein